MTRKIIIGIALLLFFLAGIYITKQYYAWQEIKVQEESQVLLEKIKKVYKVVTVEGHFSEVYDYQDYWGYDFSPFRKKALVRVKAKVLAGYDLNNIEITSYPEQKRIVISELPKVEILSVEHDMDYYDLSEGTFNSFSTQDLNKIQAKAKEYIVAKAEESNLLNSAEEQGKEALEMIEFMAESAGWEVHFKSTSKLLDTSKVDDIFE